MVEELEWECPVCGEWVSENNPCDCFDVWHAGRCSKCEEVLDDTGGYWSFPCGCFGSKVRVIWL